MKTKVPRDVFVGQLMHGGGKKLSERGTEFFHKIHEVRKHPPRGFRGKKG